MSSDPGITVRYEKQIRDLEVENSRLRDSKLKLIMSTANEIDRLRQYIYSLTLTVQKLKNNTNAEIIEENEEKSFITPDIENVVDEKQEQTQLFLCEHCGHTTNVNNNYYISISAKNDEETKINEISPGQIDEDMNVVHVVNVDNNDNNNNNTEEHEHKNSGYDGYEYDGYDGQYHEDDEKLISLDGMSSDAEDDVVGFSEDEDGVVDVNGDYITPGRTSFIVTRGNSVHLTAADLPELGNEQSMGEHADIPLPENFMDDSFVICDNCTSNMALQFVQKYPDTMQCSKCSSFFEFIFLCNECGKCVCSECYEYEAKMQSVDRISNHFTENKLNKNIPSQQLILLQQQINDQCASTLNKLIALNSSSLKINEFSLKLCYLICYFLDDIDLCQMLDVSIAARLFDFFWFSSPPTTSLQRKFGYTDIHLLHSLKWAINPNKTWTIKQVIDDDIMISNYLSKNYQQLTFNSFIKNLTKYMEETNTNYSKLLDLLKLVINKNNIKFCESLEYNQYAWRELGGAPIVCSKGLYFVWNIPILQRSYCFNIDNRMLDKPFMNKYEQ